MDILIRHPWAAAVVALSFVALWWLRGSRIAAVAAAAWLVYAGYEYLMYLRVLCSGECNIRVDLLLFYPLLLLASAAGVVTSFRAPRGASSPDRPPG